MKRIETPECIPGGQIVLTAQTREDLTSYQMEVLAVGEPVYCIDPDCERCNYLMGKAVYPEAFMHPCGAKAGDWVLVAPRCLIETDQSGLYCCHQGDILAILEA